jgi:type I restriction enzyme R subunit
MDQMTTESDTCRKFVVPKLQASGWDNDPHSIAEQRSFTDGRIVVRGNQAERKKKKRADYLLRYTRDFPIAVTEAKVEYKKAADGLQQAKEYAEILGLKFAYSTNGKEIIEFDYITGIERKIENFPTPDELWSRLRAAEKWTDVAVSHLLTLDNLSTNKTPRYYQRIAIDRAVQSILQGKKRVLLTMATGTGKTDVAFQICWKLWFSKWNSKNDPTRKPRILYLADRNFLVNDPKDKTFAAFGDARHKIEGGLVVHSRELYFSTYQSIAEDENRPGLYKSFARDFFDLIIVDECHRGSARDGSNWQEILKYFEPAYQLGMTATPKREDNRDTYLYFGNPVYTYSLRQGIDDGFLAPYRVHRIVTQWDAAGWRPSKDDLDRYGRAIPDELYTTADFEKRIALRARTQAVARHLTDFLKKTDRFAKTIVFCVDQEHASEMRTALNNLNSDLVGSTGASPVPSGAPPGGTSVFGGCRKGGRTTPRPRRSSSRNSRRWWLGGTNGKKRTTPGKFPPPSCWRTVAISTARTRAPGKTPRICRRNSLPPASCKRSSASRKSWATSRSFSPSRRSGKILAYERHRATTSALDQALLRG